MPTSTDTYTRSLGLHTKPHPPLHSLWAEMPSPAGVLTVQGDRTAAVAVVERLHALAAKAARSEEDPSPSQPRAPEKAPRVQPSDPDDVPVKTVQIGADSSRTTRITGNLEKK